MRMESSSTLIPCASNYCYQVTSLLVTAPDTRWPALLCKLPFRELIKDASRRVSPLPFTLALMNCLRNITVHYNKSPVCFIFSCRSNMMFSRSKDRSWTKIFVWRLHSLWMCRKKLGELLSCYILSWSRNIGLQPRISAIAHEVASFGLCT